MSDTVGTLTGTLFNLPPGDCVEVGVGNGQSALAILPHVNGGRLFAYDTFSGFPLDTVDEGYDRDLCRSIGGPCNESVRADLESKGIVCVPGVFPVTFWKSRPEKVAFVHLDADTYVGTKSGLDLFSPLMGEGGFFLIHDYVKDASVMRGVHRAVHEFLAEHLEWGLVPMANTYARVDRVGR